MPIFPIRGVITATRIHPNHITFSTLPWGKLFRFRKRDLVCLPGLLFGIWFLVNFRWVKVTSRSMEPTIESGQTLLMTTHVKTLKRGDIVEVKSRLEQDVFIHRIVGIPGESVKLDSGWPYKLQTDQYFIRGDNPIPGASDSGIYKRSDITKKLLGIVPFRMITITRDQSHTGVQVSIDHECPRWSPDGSKILFIRESQKGDRSIQIIDLTDGQTRVRKICSLPCGKTNVQWNGNNAICFILEETDTWYEVGLGNGSEIRVTQPQKYQKMNPKRMTVEDLRVTLFKHPRKEVWVGSRQVPVGNITHLRLFLFDGTQWTKITNEGE